jgi:carboxypeptidase Q
MTSTMIRRAALSLALIALTAPIGAQQTERVDTVAIKRIRDEGMNRSKVMEIASWLTDVYGPRLTGSPNIRRAADWTVQTMTSWGVSNARLDYWGEFGRGWENTRFHAQVLEPTPYQVIGYLGAWGDGTEGPLTGNVVYVPAPQSMADVEKFRGKLRGAWIMTTASADQPTQTFRADATRQVDSSLAAMTRAWETYRPDTSQAAAGRGGRGAGGGGGGGGRGAGGRGGAPVDSATLAARQQAQQALTQLIASEGILGYVRTGRGTDGTIFVSGGGSRTAGAPRTPPAVYLITEHYGRIFRTVSKGVPVKLEVDARVRFYDSPADRQGFNVVGEIPGTDPVLKDQVVMLGGHFDSWQGGTGATDNAAGSATMLEAMRILKLLNLPMKRTVRIGLWGGEEQGLIGSRQYARRTFTDTLTGQPNDAHRKFQAYFNVDNGGGAIRGIYLQQNDSIGKIFKQWFDVGFKDWGPFGINRGNTGGTDHQSYDGVGLPGFQFVQDGLDYSSRTHHSNMDVYEKLIPNDMMRNSVIVAAFVYQAANRDRLLPRKPFTPGGGGRGRGGGN